MTCWEFGLGLTDVQMSKQEVQWERLPVLYASGFQDTGEGLRQSLGLQLANCPGVLMTQSKVEMSRLRARAHSKAF